MKKLLTTIFLTLNFCTLNCIETSTEIEKIRIMFQPDGETYFLDSLLPKNSEAIVFDVGANKGNWTRLAKSIQKEVTIYSFEPNSETFQLYKKNTSHLKKIHPFNFGFSNYEDDQVTFYTYADIDPNHCGLDGLYSRNVLYQEFEKKPRELIVKIKTLDSFCNEHNITKIDLLKIDTEGEEYNVLLGAQKILDSGIVSAIQFEYGGCFIDSNCRLKDIYLMLTSFGYKIYRLESSNLKKIDSWNDTLEDYKYANYAALKEN